MIIIEKVKKFAIIIEKVKKVLTFSIAIIIHDDTFTFKEDVYGRLSTGLSLMPL